VRIIFCAIRTVDIKGIHNHHVNDIGIGTVGGAVNTQHGLFIVILHQYALLGNKYKQWKVLSFLLSSRMGWHV
jgi:hypothetical protein